MIRRGDRVLEVGPDNHPSTYRQLVEVEVRWETVDIFEHPALTFTADSSYGFPIDDDAFDVVISGQVLEHVPKPWLWMRELARVTKPGGLVATIVPVSWPYHTAPVDCWRVYPDGMRALYDDAGLDTVLAEWGSLETPRPRRALPGRSECKLRRTLRWYSRLVGPIGIPVERAFDTVAIARKPNGKGQAH
jgi:SAM-dependent methyltransferase